MLNAAYQKFLMSKAAHAPLRGMTNVPNLSAHLFPFQRHCVEFALRAGASACFLSTGLGKTEVQLEFLQRAIEATNGWALLMTPLAVAGQTKRRADRWGYDARVIRDQAHAGPGINIVNYDRLDKVDPEAFSVVSLDEASILKSFGGKTNVALTKAFRHTPYKLVATATPAPNDHMELGNYSNFLDVMASNEMLSRFFINDTSTASQEWRLKAHAVGAFWDWVASWGRAAELPSDITGTAADDAGFVLPSFEVTRHRAADSAIDRDLADMFGAPSLSATTLHNIKRQTIAARADVVAGIVDAEPDEAWLIWVDTDYEADAVRAAIPDAIEVRGSQTADEKERLLDAFATGSAKRLIAKPSQCGFGLDWSHCARMVFVGRSYSYETWYQAVRRCWRFGQTRTVKVHIVVAEGEAEIGRVIDRKANDHDIMKRAMRDAMRRASARIASVKVPYQPKHKTELAPWIYVV